MRRNEFLIWNRPMETMDREKLAKLQGERLHKTIQRVYKNVPMYRQRMQEKGLDPNDIRTIDDLKYLPFTQKTDLRDNYPFGTVCGEPRRDSAAARVIGHDRQADSRGLYPERPGWYGRSSWRAASLLRARRAMTPYRCRTVTACSPAAWARIRAQNA